MPSYLILMCSEVDGCTTFLNYIKTYHPNFLFFRPINASASVVACSISFSRRSMSDPNLWRWTTRASLSWASWPRPTCWTRRYGRIRTSSSSSSYSIWLRTTVSFCATQITPTQIGSSTPRSLDLNAPEGWRRESIPKRIGSTINNDPRLRYLTEAIPGKLCCWEENGGNI